MAIVVGPAMSLAASGNMGAICYSRWRGGAVARARTTYTYTPNTLQQSREAVITACAIAWGSTLLELERQAWRELARSIPAYDRFGRAYTCTGYQLYMRLNVQRGMIPLGIQSIPPALGAAFMIGGLAAAWNLLLTNVVASVGIPPTTGVPDLVQYWRTGPFDSPGRHALPQEFKFLDVERPVADWTGPPLMAGKFYWFRARAGMDSGEIGPFYEFKFAA